MANPNLLIANLGRHLGIQLTLEDGLCALFADGKESVIIEAPVAGDVIILHCHLPVAPAPRLAEKMLRLNFDLNTLHGCWLALDDKGDVRLCAQLPFAQLDEHTFVHWVLGFIQQVRDTLPLLQSAPAPSAGPSALGGSIRTGLPR